jgi:hypothetical protein
MRCVTIIGIFFYKKTGHNYVADNFCWRQHKFKQYRLFLELVDFERKFLIDARQKEFFVLHIQQTTAIRRNCINYVFSNQKTTKEHMRKQGK